MEKLLPTALEDGKLQELLSMARDYAVTHGILFRTSEDPGCDEVAEHAPFTLLPTPLCRASFLQVQALQVHVNLLTHRAAMDYNFLRHALQSTIKVDDFTRRLWDIYEAVRREDGAQSLHLGLLRSDYMQHVEQVDSVNHSCADSLRQVENNTISCGAGGLSLQVGKYHRLLLNHLGHDNTTINIPENKSMEGFADGLISAWEAYGNGSAVILFLVQLADRNVYDQRWLEYAVYERNPRVRVVRATFQQISGQAALDDDLRLTLNGQEIAVVYYRYGYMPGNYKSEQDWEARLMLERSKAVKCPSVNYQLAGTKKVQQVLSSPGAVERFIPDKRTADRIRATFAGQYSLEMGDSGDKAVAMAIEEPNKYVLKPQREGGGNNLFSEDILKYLKEFGDSETRDMYILMERIMPAVSRNYLVTAGGNPVTSQDTVSELGIHGVIMGTEDEVIKNYYSGYLLRTKSTHNNEGGLMTGTAAVDSPYLI